MTPARALAAWDDETTTTRPAAVEEYVPAREKAPDMAELVRSQLLLLGEDPDRAGLLRTPERVARSLTWLTRENMVLVRDIDFYSMCEHHMLSFFGKVHVAYVPDGRIVGLSKLPRLVEVFARRLQVRSDLRNRSLRRSARCSVPAVWAWWWKRCICA